MILDNTPPEVQVTNITESSAFAHASDTTVYYGVGSGNYTVQVHATDPAPGSGQAAGLDTLTFPATTSGGASFDYDGETSVYRSRVYSFDVSDTFSSDATVTALDRAGNAGSGIFTVLRDATPPAVTIQATPNGESNVDVSWSANDSGSGVATYDVDVRVDGGDWTPWLAQTTQTGATYHGDLGHSYTFRVTATDHVSNFASAEAGAVTKSVTKYYYFGGQRVAVRQPEGVYYLHADHLGSTSLTTDGSGGVVARQLYHPFGTVRWNEGALPTDFTFTGQRLDATGLMFYHARYYAPYLNRWIQPDTIIPDPASPQSLNRYSYVRNNPLRFVDPSGHVDCSLLGDPDDVKACAAEKIRASTILIYEQRPGEIPTRSYAAIVAPHVVAWHGHAAITDQGSAGFMLRVWLPNGDELAFDADDLIQIKINEELTLVGFPVNDPLGSTVVLGNPSSVNIGNTVVEPYFDETCGCMKFQYGVVTELLHDPYSHFYSTDPSDLVQAGDSGGGVFDGNGRFIGVHIGSLRSDPQTNITAFAYSHEGYPLLSRATYSLLVAITEVASVASTSRPIEPSPGKGVE